MKQLCLSFIKVYKDLVNNKWKYIHRKEQNNVILYLSEEKESFSHKNSSMNKN